MNKHSFRILVLILTFTLVLFILSFSKSNKAPSAPLVLGDKTQSENCQINGALPDPECTPGAIFETATKEIICVKGYSKTVRNVSQSTKNAVYQEYGIASHKTGEYEIDHFISLALGGSNDIANLFPEAALPKPGFHEKDKVENYLLAEVCSGRMTLTEGQRKVSWDWLNTYKQQHPENPVDWFLGILKMITGSN